MNLIQDKSGNYSSMRVMLLASLLLLVYQLWEFRFAYRLEVVKDEPNYSGLALLFGAMVINFVVVILLKVLQTKYEQ